MGMRCSHCYLHTEHVEYQRNCEFFCANNRENVLVKFKTIDMAISMDQLEKRMDSLEESQELILSRVAAIEDLL